MANEKKSYQIELRYDDSTASSAEMQALADVLEGRGHHVTIQKVQTNGLVRELSRSARDLRDMAGTVAENVLDAANFGMQVLKGMVEPFVNKGDNQKAEEAKPENAQEQPKEQAPAGDGFDAIGPAATTAAVASSDRAVVVTAPEHLKDAGWDAMRIGFISKTALNHTWQPAALDAMVIPHNAFRPYLEYIHWDPSHIFEGGYLALDKDRPDMSHEDAQKRFNLNASDGPVILIMATGFPQESLQTLMVQLSLLKMPMQVFFYHGGDATKANILRSLAQQYAVNARMFGKVNGLPDYIAMADIAVASVDESLSEMLENTGIPTVYVAGNTVSARINFLEHERAVLIAPQLYKLSAILAQPITDLNMRENMRKAAQDIAKLASIELCADGIEAALAKKSELIPDPNRRTVSDDGFETIGQMPAPAAGQNFLMPQSAPVQQAPAEATQQPAPGMVQPAPSMVQPAPGMVQPTMGQPAPAMIQPAPVMPAPGLTPPPAAPFLTPGMGARSKEDIRKEYTNLLIVEKNIDKSLETASSEVQKWELRLDLARQNNREDLVNSAMISLQSAKTQEMSLLQQKDQIQQQKAVLKQSARLVSNQPNPGDAINFTRITDAELFGPSKEELSIEKEFQALQQQEALQRLKNDMGIR